MTLQSRDQTGYAIHEMNKAGKGLDVCRLHLWGLMNPTDPGCPPRARDSVELLDTLFGDEETRLGAFVHTTMNVARQASA
jgi:hypothetical protein